MRHLADRFERTPDGSRAPGRRHRGRARARPAGGQQLAADAEPHPAPAVRARAHRERDDDRGAARAPARAPPPRAPAPGPAAGPARGMGRRASTPRRSSSHAAAPGASRSRSSRRASPIDTVERALHSSGFHPALAHEAVRWARDARHRARERPRPRGVNRLNEDVATGPRPPSVADTAGVGCVPECATPPRRRPYSVRSASAGRRRDAERAGKERYRRSRSTNAATTSAPEPDPDRDCRRVGDAHAVCHRSATRRRPTRARPGCRRPATRARTASLPTRLRSGSGGCSKPSVFRIASSRRRRRVPTTSVWPIATSPRNASSPASVIGNQLVCRSRLTSTGSCGPLTTRGLERSRIADEPGDASIDRSAVGAWRCTSRRDSGRNSAQPGVPGGPDNVSRPGCVNHAPSATGCGSPSTGNTT